MFRFLIIALSLASTSVLAGEGGNSLPQLDVSTFPSQIFWLLVTFGLLNFLIAKSALPIIHEVMQKRHHRIERDLEQAERLMVEVKAIKESYEKLQAESVAKAQDLVARTTFEIEAKQSVENGKLDAQIIDIMRRGEQQISEKCAKLQDGLQSLGSDLVQTIIAELSGKNVDEVTLNAYLQGEKSSV
jgi:F-type H+-transporting ATPase subunit b